MSTFLERLEGLVSRIYSSPYPTPNLFKVPDAAYEPGGTLGHKIPKDDGYFSLRINELFLKDGRALWDTYDPMLVSLLDFLYDGKRMSVPFVISSELLKQKSNAAPHAVLFNDILVAGPHPFRGGNVAISLVLYKVKRDNFARKAMKFVEGVSSAAGVPADIAFWNKVGTAFIDGLETLIDLDDTVPLFGSRLEIDTSSFSGLSTSSWLLTPTNDFARDNVLVENGRLSIRGERGTQRYNSQDYVLFSLLGCSQRADESSLPFYALRRQALESVLSGEEGWKRAKALLLTLYQQMITSPDLTTHEAEDLFERYKGELLHTRDTLIKTTAMSVSEDQISDEVSRLNQATKLLDLH
ncbi:MULTISPECIES: hypothetical protein [unclassified Bradyrhizobium]|uniref:hypothetical protein n=1 Tax=unclassified Bradyrhizobium TaxID=2631580 RepID=UPI002915F45D|nr:MULTISPECIES: hypothetical protein [unclassified Bradyrhizobium]